MNIKHLHYFMIIVESNFNISSAAKLIHISQPALSQMIVQFEKTENVTLFERSHGRLQKLTPAGEVFYAYAKEIIEKYDNMMEELQSESTQLKGKIKIGIPPVIISIVFPEILPKLITENPKIKFEITELGAVELKKSLLLQDIPIAVLLNPTGLDENVFEEVILSSDTLSAFMSIDNPLAQKDVLEWDDLHNQPVAIFDSTYMIHHQLMNTFTRLNIKPQLYLQSASWDLLLNSTRNSNLITVLPSPVAQYYQMPDVKKVSIRRAIPWEIVLCRKKQNHYSMVEDFVFKYIVDYFTTQH